MENLKRYGGYGMISIRNAKFAKIGLQDMINYIDGNVKEMSIVEIGSYVGDSSEIFAKNFKTVTCIDPWVNGYDENDSASYMRPMGIVEDQFDELCKKYLNITKIKDTSLNAVKQFEDDSIDVVYIDGLHAYEGVSADIKAWLPKIKAGGYLSGHDYQFRFKGTIDAVNNFRKPDKIFMDTSWIIHV